MEADEDYEDVEKVDSSKSSLKHRELSSPPGGLTLKWVESEILAFSQNPDGYDALAFPASLNNEQRKHAHMVCERRGLSSESRGKGDERRIWIFNGEAAKEAQAKAAAKESKLPKGMSEIIFGFLFLGSGRDARDHEELLANEITHVLNVTQEWTPHPHDSITHHSIPLFDVLDEDISQAFEQSYELIESVRSKNQRILVHCVVGKSRSATIVIAYVMRHLQLSLVESFNYVKQRRKIILPNDGFMKQLVLLEHTLYGKATMQAGDWKIGMQKAGKAELVAKKEAEATPKPKWNNNADEIQVAVEKLFTDATLKKGVEESCGGKYSRPLLNKFLAWVGKRTASSGELAKFNEKKAANVAKDYAKAWYLNNCE